MFMRVVIGRGLAGGVISGPDGQAHQQYFVDPYDHPTVEEVKNKPSANDCRGSKDDHNSYHSGKIHIKLLYSLLHTLGLMLFMPVPATFLTDHVKEGTDAAVVKDDDDS
jgi:hypothetical protein